MPSTSDTQTSMYRRKQEKVRAKNSKAQKKYRERKQDEKRELEQSADRLAAEVIAAEAQRDELSCAVAHLDLRVREATFRMENHKEVNEPIYIPAVDGYSNLRIGERPGLMLRAVYSPPKRWTHAETMALSVRDYALMRKDLVLRAGQLLLANPQEDEQTQEGALMRELMKESHGVTAFLAIHRPEVLYMLSECRLDCKDVPASQPPPSFWSSILRQMKLSQEQEKTLIGFLIELRETNRKLFVERERIRQALVGHIDACSQLPSFTDGLHHSMNRYCWASLVRRLQENIDDQHMAKSRFHVKCSCLWTMADIFGANQMGINVFQDARLLTLSWPFFPKVIGVVEALAEQHGIPPEDNQADDASTLSMEHVEDSLETPYVPVCTKLIEEYIQHRFRLSPN